MTLTRRPATDADRPWLEELRRVVYADLFQATWGGWDEARHTRHFAESWERGGIEVVGIEGEPVGMIQIAQSEECVEVIEIQIRPEHQGKGVGTRLLEDVVDRARRRGRRVALSTGRMNRGAGRLFRRLGFEETGRSETHVHFEVGT